MHLELTVIEGHGRRNEHGCKFCISYTLPTNSCMKYLSRKYLNGEKYHLEVRRS